jgi:uncharacterized protein (DUF2141 family)
MNKTKMIAFALFLMGLQFSDLYSQTVDLTVTNFESSDGGIVLGIYRDQSSFDAEKPALNKVFQKGSNVSGSTLKVSFNLDPGTYGIALLDDENSDQKMNYNWIGWPKEGFGFSNLYHTGLSKPSFSSFKFSVVKGQRIAVTIKVRYM